MSIGPRADVRRAPGAIDDQTAAIRRTQPYPEPACPIVRTSLPRKQTTIDDVLSPVMKVASSEGQNAINAATSFTRPIRANAPREELAGIDSGDASLCSSCRSFPDSPR